MDNLTSRVMLVSLNISVFQGRKIDKKTSREVAEKHNALSTDAGDYTKRTIGKHFLDEINRIATAARGVHAERTLPWSNDGERLLSVEGYYGHCDHIGNLRTLFYQAVESFIEVYPDAIEQARKRLNGLFDPSDYPPIETLRHRFGFRTHARPLPDFTSHPLMLDDTSMAQLRADLETEVEQRVGEAIKDTAKRLATSAERMVERLSDPERTFHDTLVGNVRELVQLMPTLNITNDAQLAAITEEMRKNLCSIEPGVLRADPVIREQVADHAAEIVSKLQSIYF